MMRTIRRATRSMKSSKEKSYQVITNQNNPLLLGFKKVIFFYEISQSRCLMRNAGPRKKIL
jgi:hypothetical protein